MSLRRLAPLLLLLVSGPVPAAAQNLSTLYGRIVDTSEGGIADAGISVVNQDTGARRLARSEPDGAYSVNSLEAGVYTVTVRKEGFHPFIRFGVRLEPSGATRADFGLVVGSMLETITVHGTAPTLERADASTGSLFEHEEISRMPLNGAGLLALFDMVPGTNITPATRGEAGQFTTNGQRPNTNYFTIDGVSANNGISAGGLPAQSTGGTLPSLSAFGSMDSLISLDAVQEVRAQTSTAVAEFGRLPGAGIVLNSQAGGNEFHGSTNYRLRHELMSANDWFSNQAALDRLPLRMNAISQTFGGPLRRNHTFFFLSYEHISLDQPFVWTQPVPSLAIRSTFAPWAQAAAVLLPAPNGSALAGNLGVWTGHNTQPAALNTGGARIDQAITSRLTLFGRYNDSPSSNQFGSLQVNRLDLHARSLTVGLNARPAANLTFDLRANESLTQAESVWMPECGLQPVTAQFLVTEPCDYLVRLTIDGVGQLESGQEGKRRQRQFQSVAAAALRYKSHSLGWGADYRRITAVRRDADGTLAIIADQLSDLAGIRNVWYATENAVNSDAEVRELSLWVQDTWQATRRLTIAAGLRWEFSPAPVPGAPVFVYDPVAQQLNMVSGQPLWPTSYHDYAPRLGFALRLTRDGRTVLRGGGGLYYDSSMSIATDILNGGPLNITQFRSQSHAPFNSQLSYGFMPGLALPEVAQWNISLEHGFSARDTLSAGYVGASGRGLLRRELGGPADSPTSYTALTNDNGESDYSGLQVQYHRRFQGGLEAHAAYTWSHSLDNDSSDSFLTWTGPGSPPSRDRASSDFNLRHSFSGSLNYQAPLGRSGTAGRVLGGWLAAGIFRARSGFPITVQQSEDYNGIGLTNAFRPDLVYGQPLWFGDANSPAGRRLNPFAFAATPSGQQGTLGRNALDGFGMSQVDMALSREFRAGDHAALQIRLEAFNVFNHPNFADPVKFMDNPLFGQSSAMLNMELGTGTPGSGLSPILQSGGPRLFQLSLRFHF